MLISGNKSKYLNFYEIEIRKVFKEVTRANREIQAKTEPSHKIKGIVRPSASIQCDECPKEMFSMRTMKKHVKEEHTSSKLPMDKKKKGIQLQVHKENPTIAVSCEGFDRQEEINNETRVMNIADQQKM